MAGRLCIFYIVRHGQTSWNAKKLIQGHSDIPLNKTGKQQAKELSAKLEGIEFAAAYSSDLSRATQTARILLGKGKRKVVATRSLRERQFGHFEGKPWKEFEEANKVWESLSKKLRQEYKPHPQYESDGEVAGRFIAFLKDKTLLHFGQTVLIVTHGGLMRAFLNHITEDMYLRGSIGNSAYIKLATNGQDFNIEELIDIKKPV